MHTHIPIHIGIQIDTYQHLLNKIYNPVIKIAWKSASSKCVHIYKYIQMHVYIFMHTHTYIHLYMNFILNAQIIRTLICCPYNFYTNTHIHIWIKVNIDTHTYMRVFRDQQH